MLNALASGTLIRTPKTGTSANGKRWANATIRVPTGQNREGDAETAFVSVIAFGDVADRLAKLDKGDAISVQGSLKATTYEKNGETRHGLEIVANAVLSPYDARSKRSDEPQPPRPPQPQGGFEFDDQPSF
jgi:single-strand DNA-binding protein